MPCWRWIRRSWIIFFVEPIWEKWSFQVRSGVCALSNAPLWIPLPRIASYRITSSIPYLKLSMSHYTTHTSQTINRTLNVTNYKLLITTHKPYITNHTSHIGYTESVRFLKFWFPVLSSVPVLRIFLVLLVKLKLQSWSILFLGYLYLFNNLRNKDSIKN